MPGYHPNGIPLNVRPVRIDPDRSNVMVYTSCQNPQEGIRSAELVVIRKGHIRPKIAIDAPTNQTGVWVQLIVPLVKTTYDIDLVNALIQDRLTTTMAIESTDARFITDNDNLYQISPPSRRQLKRHPDRAGRVINSKYILHPIMMTYIHSVAKKVLLDPPTVIGFYGRTPT